MVNKLDKSDGTNVITWNTTNNIITQEHAHKESNITVLPLPLSDSDETDVFDFGGVTKLIDFTCIRKDTPTNLATFITTLQSIVQGEQSPTQLYPFLLTTDIQGAKKVKIVDTDWNYIGGDRNRIIYSIKFVESSDRG